MSGAVLPAPSRELVAKAAARYVTGEFTTFRDWLSYEDELAAEWLKDPAFTCTVEYATLKVMEQIRWKTQMSSIAAEHGGGAKGVAVVVGRVVGEWVAGGTTIDRELQTWG
jgi:hypothetical protein